MTRRRSQQRCLGPGCRATIPPCHRFCDPCWRLLPGQRRAEIGRAMQSKAWHLVSSLAIEAAGWLRNNRPAAIADRRIGGER